MKSVWDANDASAKQIAHEFIDQLGGPKGFVTKLLAELERPGTSNSPMTRAKLFQMMQDSIHFATDRNAIHEDLGLLSKEDLEERAKGLICKMILEGKLPASVIQEQPVG